MNKTLILTSILATGLAFATANKTVENSMHSVQNSMNKVANAANAGVSKMVLGVTKMAHRTENFGNNAANKMASNNKKNANVAKNETNS